MQIKHSTLAKLLTVRGDLDSAAAGGPCVAWMESADRRCGKPAASADAWLCTRHNKVAEKRAAKLIAARAG